MVHIPWYTVELLRKHGYNARYLAVGNSPYWKKCDYNFIPSASPFPFIRIFKEFIFFWMIMSQYHIVHLNFMITLTESGWELPILKKLGRKIVVHYRGCEIRDWEKNMGLHPACNICQDCDYNRQSCTGNLNRKRRELSKEYGDYFMVTTPDMLEFASYAVHFPFFSPEIASLEHRKKLKEVFKIVHVTCHPGIEGSEQISECVDNLKRQGYSIDFVFLRGVKHDRVFEELKDADISIGKMKMIMLMHK